MRNIANEVSTEAPTSLNLPIQEQNYGKQHRSKKSQTIPYRTLQVHTCSYGVLDPTRPYRNIKAIKDYTGLYIQNCKRAKATRTYK